ncbi:hypothetical protein G9464_12965 [Halostella sp. JP-L12]|uniref:helix-turn-helix transcriptional regulator n=1 Tax=Halostella TaxID=1843185 RepID=UPI000EF808D5|nr:MULTISPECIES: helix-turn-helix domain-containing protein [Halostella]NHN48496.1 hypothetical protein [Halostella sp. JP-L12]
MKRAFGVALAFAVCVAVLAGAGAFDPSPAADRTPVSADTNTGAETASIGAQQFDYTEFRIEVHANGSARWTFHYERRLTNDSETEQFRTFADRFEENETQLYDDFRRQANALAAAGENETNRTMDAVAFSRTAAVEEELGTSTSSGVVEMSFTWTGFASVDGDRVVVGDVFEDGLYVGPDQALVVDAGDGLAFDEVTPSGEPSAGSLESSDTVTWTGERRFTDNRPRVVLAPPDAVTTTETPDENTTAATGSDDANDGSGSDTLASDALPVLALVAALALGAVAVVALRRNGAILGDDDSASAGAGGTDSPGAGGAAAAEPAVEDEEMLSDEDRVVKLLNENGGRMKQVNIVDETGWSKSKVSMLLSDMEDEGTISKLRVGRENIISLDGDEPAAAGSPFDEDE